MMIRHLLRPRTGYQWLAMSAGTTDGVFLGLRTVATGPHATELSVVAGGFALLIAGAAISWFKDRLLQHTEGVPVPGTQGPESPGGAAQ